nr:coiled-coil domain-containing protein 158 [Nothobranchius furzeri]
MKSSRKATKLRQPKPKEHGGEQNAAAAQVETNQQGLSLERKIELEKQRRFTLINEVNRLTAAVKERQDKLEGLKKVKALQHSEKNTEETEKQYQEIHQLEISLKRMKDRTEEKRKDIAVARSVSANLNLKSSALDKELKQRERQLGLMELEKAKKQRCLDLAAAKSKEVQMKNEALEQRKEMSAEMQKLLAHQKEVQTGLQAMRQSVLIPGNNLAEADVQLLENGLEDTTDFLDFGEIKQLTEAYLINEDIREKQYILKNLKLDYMILQHSDKAKWQSSDNVTEEGMMELNKEVHRVEDLRAALKEPQALLSAAEQKIDAVCLRLNCIPLEELSSMSNKKKIRRIRIQLNSQKTDKSSNQKKVYNMEDDSSESSEDEGWLTREEIKEKSKRLVEAQHTTNTSGNKWEEDADHVK